MVVFWWLFYGIVLGLFGPFGIVWLGRFSCLTLVAGSENDELPILL